MPKPEEPAVEAPKEEEIQLRIGDIQTCKTIIEIASSKGAFAAKELHVVGLTYDRIVKWLLANQPKVTEAEETSEAEGETKND
jgi:hypothetical protein